MRRQAQSLIAALLPLILASCVYSKHPLSDESTSTLDRRLLGTWAAAAKDGKVSGTDSTLIIGRKPGTKNTLEAVVVRLDYKDTVKIGRQTWYAKTGKFNYLSIGGDTDTEEDGKAYLICRYDLPKPRTFRIFLPDPHFIGAAVQKGELKGKVEYNDAAEPAIANEKAEPKSEGNNSGSIQSVALTDSPEKILEFLNAHVSESFQKEPIVYRKTSE